MTGPASGIISPLLDATCLDAAPSCQVSGSRSEDCFESPVILKIQFNISKFRTSGSKLHFRIPGGDFKILGVVSAQTDHIKLSGGRTQAQYFFFFKACPPPPPQLIPMSGQGSEPLLRWGEGIQAPITLGEGTGSSPTSKGL